VLGDDGAVLAPAERYLAYLSGLERSPNTVRAYALSLRPWFEFPGLAGAGWAEAGPEDVARFVAWLRAPAENVIVLETGAGQRSAATVNRHLAAVFGFYDHHARAGVGVAEGLIAWRRVSRGSYKPFLHHVTRGRPVPTRPARLVVTRRAPRTLADPRARGSVHAYARVGATKRLARGAGVVRRGRTVPRAAAVAGSCLVPRQGCLRAFRPGAAQSALRLWPRCRLGS